MQHSPHVQQGIGAWVTTCFRSPGCSDLGSVFLLMSCLVAPTRRVRRHPWPGAPAFGDLFAARVHVNISETFLDSAKHRKSHVLGQRSNFLWHIDFHLDAISLSTTVDVPPSSGSNTGFVQHRWMQQPDMRIAPSDYCIDLLQCKSAGHLEQGSISCIRSDCRSTFFRFCPKRYRKRQASYLE